MISGGKKHKIEYQVIDGVKCDMQGNPLQGMDKFYACQGTLSDPEFRAKVFAIRDAKREADFRDPQKYLKKLFCQPKRDGCTLKRACKAIETATRKLSDKLITGEMDINDYIKVIDNLKKTLEFLDKLNSEAAGRAITNLIKVDNINVSKTGGAVGGILDIEPLNELTKNEQA